MLFTKLVVAVSAYLVREELSSHGDVAQVMLAAPLSCSTHCAVGLGNSVHCQYDPLNEDSIDASITINRNQYDAYDKESYDKAFAAKKDERMKEIEDFCRSDECAVDHHKCVSKASLLPDPSRKCGTCCNGGDAFGPLSGTPRDMCEECEHCTLTEYDDGKYSCSMSKSAVPQTWAEVENLYPFGGDQMSHMPEHIPMGCFEAFNFDDKDAASAPMPTTDGECRALGDSHYWCATLVPIPRCLSKVSGIHCPGKAKLVLDVPTSDRACCCKKQKCRKKSEYTQDNSDGTTDNCCKYRIHKCDAKGAGQFFRRVGHLIQRGFTRGDKLPEMGWQLGGYTDEAEDYGMCSTIMKLEVNFIDQEDTGDEDDEDEDVGRRAPDLRAPLRRVHL